MRKELASMEEEPHLLRDLVLCYDRWTPGSCISAGHWSDLPRVPRLN